VVPDVEAVPVPIWQRTEVVTAIIIGSVFILVAGGCTVGYMMFMKK
jgi:hypothetical protein